MKKGFCFLLACVLVLAFGCGVSAASYAVPDYGIVVDVPDDYYVITRDTPESDPVWEDCDESYEDFIASMKENDYYLNFFNTADLSDVYLYVEKRDGAGNLWEWSDEELQGELDALAAKEENKMISVDHQGDFPFVTVTYPASDAEVCEMYTVADNLQIGILVFGHGGRINGNQRALAENTAASLRIDQTEAEALAADMESTEKNNSTLKYSGLMSDILFGAAILMLVVSDAAMSLILRRRNLAQGTPRAWDKKRMLARRKDFPKGTAWLGFYVYVLTPLNAVCSLLLLGIWGVLYFMAGENAIGVFLVVSAIASFGAYGLCYWDLRYLTENAYGSNIILLFFNFVFSIVAMIFLYDMEGVLSSYSVADLVAAMIPSIISSMIYLLLNFIYFKKRKALFYDEGPDAGSCPPGYEGKAWDDEDDGAAAYKEELSDGIGQSQVPEKHDAPEMTEAYGETFVETENARTLTGGIDPYDYSAHEIKD
ncbi:MAG: hypothetical protein U0M15_07275, partial [Bacillota bacterium]|nr:hypothetical protein [Bacillota bacterium]